MKLVKRYFSFLTSLIFFNFIIRILSNKVNEKNLDYSFSFKSEKISSNKLKIEMLDYNNHSLSDLSKLILIRTSFDKKISEYEINIDNNNFNKEKNKIYFILDFFDDEIYKVKYIYNKNNILIKDYLKINENVIFRLNKKRKLEEISYSPSSFKLLENEMILTIEFNESEYHCDYYHLKLSDKKISQKDIIKPKVRFNLTELSFTTVGIYTIIFSCGDTEIIISDNIKIYIYNNHVKLKRNKDYILNNTNIEYNNTFSIYLEYSVFKDQFKVKKYSTRMDATTIYGNIPDDIDKIDDTDGILTNETIIQVSNISSNNYTNIIIIDLADNNAVHNFSIYSSKYIINNNLIFYKSSSIGVDVTQPFEVNITTLNETNLDNIIVNNGYKNETVSCIKNETLYTCNGTNIKSLGNPKELSLYIDNESVNIRTVYIIYYNIDKFCQIYPNLSPIIINTYYPNILTEKFNLYSTIKDYGTKFDNKTTTTTSSYSITQTIFSLSTTSQYTGIHNLYALITDYYGEKNYIKDEYLFILEKNMLMILKLKKMNQILENI